MGKTSKLPQSTLEKILKLFDSGKYSRQELADKFGYHYVTITRYLSKHRGTERDARNRINTKEVQKLLQEGYTRAELAEKFECSNTAILFHASGAGKKQPVTPEMIEQIRTYLKSGQYNRKEVADKMNIAMSDVYKYAKGIKVINRIPTARTKEIDELYKSGYSIAALSRKFGYTCPTISRYISQPRPYKNTKTSEKTIQTIRELFISDPHITNSEIAEKCGVGLNLVGRHTKDLRIDRVPPKKLRAEDIQKIFKLYKTGHYTHKDLALLFNVSTITISRYLSEGNIKKPTVENRSSVKPNRRVPIQARDDS